MKYLYLIVMLAVFVPAAFTQDAARTNGSSNTAQQNTTAAPSADTGAPMSTHEEGMSQRGYDHIVKETRHELVMLPRYNLFDDLSYKVSPDGTVTLMGAVTDPTIKSDAENVVKKIEGVTNVVNNIQVLPASPTDDRIRRALYRAIYGNEQLNQYSLRSVPPIHIIVNNGHVTLTGVVSRAMDKQIAGVQANSVPGTFGVQNDLVVEGDQK